MTYNFMHKIDQILKTLGLSENETKVFLGALKTGQATVSRIAYEAGIARTYAYELVEQLKTKGLLAEVEEKGKKKLEALDFEGLMAYIARKKRETEKLEKELERATSEFHALRTYIPQKTKVRFFEGVAGIKSINSEIRKDLEKLSKPYQFYVVFSADRMEEVLPGWIEHNEHIYYEPHMKKFAIISETPMLPKFLGQVEKHQQINFRFKIWPKEKNEFPTDTLCWQNKIAILDMKGHPSGIIIENKAVVETFIMWFSQMWDSLK
ncbi:MAG: helix-turn-helix domain-containing protein [Candidatus Doudnabacteria bacterium]|nr:helix-turn-helix domain-containing protein [Candidatus Doudnabacteria bacterium]